MPLLQVRGLEKWYGRRQVVNGVDFDVEQGRGGRTAGPQRGRQDHELPDDDRPDRLPTAARSCSTAATSPDCRCTSMRGPAWATWRRIPASSSSCRSKTT